jgi:cell division protein FtsQ
MRRWRLLSLVALAALASGFVGFGWRDAAAGYAAEAHEALARASGLIVRSVAVLGLAATPRRAFEEAIGGLQYGAPILLADLDAVRGRIEALPWVESASVRRHLPDTIQILVAEHVPFALWQSQGQTALISSEGEILAEPAPPEFAHLPKVVGPGAASEAKALFDLMAIAPGLSERLKHAIRVRERRWDLEFDNGVVVHLPEEDQAGAWARFVAIERDSAILARAVRAVDMRLADRVTVRLAPQAAAARRTLDKSG